MHGTSAAGLDARVYPAGPAGVLSRHEITRVADPAADPALHERLRRCALAVLNTGNEDDDPRRVLGRHPDFDLSVRWQDGAVCVDLHDAPPTAFVDGVLIRGIREHLFAVLRDLIHAQTQTTDTPTDQVFGLLRNAGVVRADAGVDMVVCWGGHAISREEYDYSKVVGYQLGLRGVNICTGCGPGAMKGPMKGATIGHAKQRLYDRRYLGLTEPGIIAAEPPNPIVSELAVLPDIEQRLEAFLRVGHVFVIFPGGVGTMEELLFLLGVALHPDNAGHPLPLILTGPPGCEDYFARVHEFIGAALGPAAQACYQIVPGDPARVAASACERLAQVRRWRADHADPAYFNWRLALDAQLQAPFTPTHASMAALDLSAAAPAHQRVVNLRRALSGIVAGNVKEPGIRAVEQHGPFELRGDAGLIAPLDRLLRGFVDERRMRLPGSAYVPSYRLVA